jgi:hypothetical protein
MDVYSGYTSIVSIDGKDFLRTNQTKSFRGVIGVALTFNRPRNFIEDYPNIMTKLKKDFNFETELDVLKSYRIMSSLGKERGNNFMNKYLEEIKKYLSEFTVFFTTIPSTKIPEIKKYGRDNGGVESKTPVDFLKELSSSYPHCCAWRLLKDSKFNSKTLLLLDFFQGEVTKAWDEIKNHSQIKVGTDDTNPFIASADILTKFVDNQLYTTKGGLRISDIKACFSKYMEPKVVFLDDLQFIVPIRREKIDVRQMLMHPSVFILKEGINSKTMGNVSEKDIIEASPAFQKILNFSYKRNAYYKFFNAQTDINLVKEGDYFIYLGEEGQKTGNYLKSLQYKINVLRIDDLDKV